MTRYTTAEPLAAAARYLRRARDNNDPEDARRCYALVGVAQAELAPGVSLADLPLRDLLVTELGQLLTRDPELAARAAVDVTTPAQFNVLSSLRARSGYQVLLDAGVWSQPPLSDFHLGDVDEELAEALAAAGDVEVPPGIPASHSWWRR